MVKRKKSRKGLGIGLTTCFSLCVHLCFCQAVQTVADKKEILIGEQVRLKIKAILPAGSYSLKNWFSLPDSIPHFEIVETGKTDTLLNKDNSKVIEQTIVFTSFDSGKWVFPSLPISFVNLAGQPVTRFKTDSIVIHVSYSPADSTDQLRDIKPIILVSVTDYNWVYITAGIIVLLLILILLYRYWKKKRKLIPGDSLAKLSPYQEAMQEINRLAKFNLQDAAAVKMYHSKIAEIFKRYAGRKQNKNLLNKTTGDLLIIMSEKNMSAGNLSNLATVLRCSDVVKFAKYLPLPDESEDCKQKITETINLLESPKPF